MFGSELCFKSEKTRGFRKKSVRNYLSGINLDKTIQHGGKQRPKIGKHHVQKEVMLNISFLTEHKVHMSENK